MPTFPISVLSSSNDTRPGTLGLGPTSTLLTHLYDQGHISSRAFSLYIGTGSPKIGGDINGSLVLGGYDAARFEGEVWNFTLQNPKTAPFTVNVEELILEDPIQPGKNVSLLEGASGGGSDDTAGSQKGFDAQLSTDAYPLTLPPAIFERFASLTKAKSDADGALTLPASFSSTLTLVLSNGLRVTLPPEILRNNVTGHAAVSNNTYPSSSTATLGTALLTQLYLTVNYDDNTFHLAHAVQNAPFILPRTSCPKIAPIAYVKPKVSAFMKGGLVGAIVGGVIGGSAILTLLGALIVGRWRQRKERERAASNKAFELEMEEGAGKRFGRGSRERRWDKMGMWRQLRV